MAKTILAAGVAALMFMSAAASAADFAPYAPTPPRGTSWQGPYVGGNVGYQWSHVDNNGAKPNGVAGGIQAGYNVQYSQFVFGGETDLQLTDADASVMRCAKSTIQGRRSTVALKSRDKVSLVPKTKYPLILCRETAQQSSIQQ